MPRHASDSLYAVLDHVTQRKMAFCDACVHRASRYDSSSEAEMLENDRVSIPFSLSRGLNGVHLDTFRYAISDMTEDYPVCAKLKAERHCKIAAIIED